MRRNRFVVAALLSLLVAVGCSSSSDSSKDQAATPTSARPLKDALTVGTPADSFVTTGDRANLGMFPINTNMFETLVRMSPTFSVEPWLAERWEYRGDNTFRFFLRTGVQFHNGAPFNAEAVKFSLDRLARTGGGSLRLGPDSTKVVDTYTVDITPTAPNLRLVDQLVHPSVAPMVAPGTDVGTKPVGTGPFKFVSYTRSERLVVERNDGYWGDKAKLRTITFRFIPDDNARWLSLKTGDVDLIYDLPRQLLAEAGKTPGIKTAVAPPGATELMDLNRSGTEPYTILSDKAVRLAIGMAIDRKEIVDKVFTSAALVASSITPAVLLGSSSTLVKGQTFDPGRARFTLDSAGWKVGSDGIRVKDGRRLSLTMVNGIPPIDLRKPYPEFVQAKLKDVGIEVKIVETPEQATYSERLKNGEGDIFLERVAQNDATPTQFSSGFWYSKGTGDYAKWFAAGPAFDKLLEDALATSDRAVAIQKTAEALHVAVDEEAVVVPIAAVNWLFAMKEGVSDFLLHGSARHVRWAPVSWSANS
jgi:peptide/nickel transport system substrate-binding protein